MDFDKSKKFTLFWKVDNFRNSLLKKNEFISSSIITLKNFCNTRWCLEIYPKGCKDSKINYSTIYLRRKDNSDPLEIEVDFELYISSELLIQGVKKFKRGTGSGCNVVVHKLLELNSFVITCIMNASAAEFYKDNSITFKTLPQYQLIQSVSLTPEISKEICLKSEKELLKVQSKLLTYPNQCLISSRFQVEKRSFYWPINLQENKQEIPVISFTNVPSLLLSLRLTKKENTEVLKIYMKPIEDDFINKKVFLICTIFTMDNKNRNIDGVEEEHLFENDKIWQLDHEFTIQDKIDNQFSLAKTLSCELEFSDGEVYHQILWTKDVSPINEKNNSETGSSNKIFIYDKMSKYYDVTLCSCDETFNAHKVILSAISPVFEAMFESGMKESLSNKVLISDIDSDTLKKMLHFIYSGILTDIDYHCANKLFSAADKYEIIPLKDLCRSILNNNLNEENVCDILSLADAHSDPQLKNVAMEFLEMNKSSVLRSSEWMDFMSNNRELALEILLCVGICS